MVLLYHVLPGKVPAAKVLKTESAKTAEGSKVSFSAGVLLPPGS